VSQLDKKKYLAAKEKWKKSSCKIRAFVAFGRGAWKRGMEEQLRM